MQIFIAGDSTAAPKLSDKRPESGWGEHLEQFFKPGVQVLNFAQNGKSSSSFIKLGLLDEIESKIQSGDFLLIQFGHNDEKIKTPRGTDPFTTFQENLRKYLAVALSHEAVPILLTPVSRRVFKDGKIDPTNHGDYPQAMKALADEENVSLLDMYQVTQDFLNQFEPEACRQFFLQLKPHIHPNYPDGAQDNTHFNLYGAEKMAQLVVETLKKDPSPLKNYLKE